MDTMNCGSARLIGNGNTENASARTGRIKTAVVIAPILNARCMNGNRSEDAAKTFRSNLPKRKSLQSTRSQGEEKENTIVVPCLALRSKMRGDVMPLLGGAISLMMGMVMLGITFQDRERFSDKLIKAAGIMCAATCAAFAALCFIVFFFEG